MKTRKTWSGFGTEAVVAGCACVLACSHAFAQFGPFDFSEVTALAEGAVTGQTTATPIRGFDLQIMKNGVVVYHRAFGQWSLDQLANADSATKTLSGAMMIAIADSSALPFSLDSRLSDFVPSFAGNKASITIRQCFAHTSGLGSSTAVGSSTLTLRQAADQIALVPLAFSPAGSAFSYGGTSMHAAGAAAEVAGGKPWNALFEERLARPLGLRNTRYALTTPSNPRIAGGAESTASDFARFMEMLRREGESVEGRRVLSGAGAREIFRRQTAPGIAILNTPLDSPTTDGADYGVGVWLAVRAPDGRLRGALAAGARGFTSWIDFDRGVVGVLATDISASGNVQPLIYELFGAAGAAVERPRCPSDLNYDRVVDNRDFALFVEGYNIVDCAETQPWDLTGCTADLDRDGSVDTTDFALFATAYNAFLCLP